MPETASSTSAPITRFDLQEDHIGLAADPKGVGLVVPFDFALDAECWRWLPEGVSLYVTRTPRLEDPSVTIELARQVSDEAAVATAVGSLTAVNPAAVAYGCTSGSFVGGVAGEKQLQASMIRAGSSKAVTTSGALVSALTALGARRIAIATPYNEPLTRLLAAYLEESGFEVVASCYLDLEANIARVAPQAVRDMAKMIDRPEADAIFFSCTNLRTFDIIHELEAELGKPVLSANQITMWAALRAGNLPLPSLHQTLFP